MTIRRMDSEEESLFRSYPYSLYFVQSPSTVSHANSADLRHTAATLDSPTRTTNQRLALSHYSSSRGSSYSFLHEKKMVSYDLQSHGTGAGMEEDGGEKCFLSVRKNGLDLDHDHDQLDGDHDHKDYYESDEYEDEILGWGTGGWWKYFTFRNSSSLAWISLQISLRVLVSLMVALLVFYLVTKPPSPKFYVKMGGIGGFGLGEGIDGSGVTTKILNCNCTVKVSIDNKSKLFDLHIHPPFLAISFANLPYFAVSRGTELYASNNGKTSFKLYVGTKNKPMYGAGRSMQDMLETKKGLPLVLKVSLKSNFHVVWKLIMPKFDHEVKCFIVLRRAYDKKHRTQMYSSHCSETS